MFINIFHLFWVIPASIFIGVWISALFSANREIDEFKIEMTEDEVDKWTL